MKIDSLAVLQLELVQLGSGEIEFALVNSLGHCKRNKNAMVNKMPDIVATCFVRSWSCNSNQNQGDGDESHRDFDPADANIPGTFHSRSSGRLKRTLMLQSH